MTAWTTRRRDGKLMPATMTFHCSEHLADWGHPGDSGAILAESLRQGQYQMLGKQRIQAHYADAKFRVEFPGRTLREPCAPRGKGAFTLLRPPFAIPEPLRRRLPALQQSTREVRAPCELRFLFVLPSPDRTLSGSLRSRVPVQAARP